MLAVGADFPSRGLQLRLSARYSAKEGVDEGVNVGFRVRKSFKIAPGVRVSVSPKSVGLSAGVKGARVSVNSRRGVTGTVGIPGSGISYSATSGASRSKPRSAPQRLAASAPSAATSKPKPNMFAPAGEKALYKAATGAGDAGSLRRFAADIPTAAGVLSLAEVIFYAQKNGDTERSRILLTRLVMSGYRPESDAHAKKYVGDEFIKLPIATGIEAVIPVDSSAIGLLLSEIEQAAGNLARATEVVEALEPTMLAAVSLAELYSAQSRWKDVLELTNGLTNVDEPSTYLLMQRGAALRESGFYDASLEALKEALRLRSRPAELRNLALIERGKTYLAAGKRSMARKDFERVMADDSRFVGLNDLIAAAS